jgi:hypothetical protein
MYEFQGEKKAKANVELKRIVDKNEAQAVTRIRNKDKGL